MSRSRVLSVLLVLFAAVIIGLPLTFGLPGSGPPESVTDSGDAINQVYWVVFVLAAIVFLIVETTLLVFMFRYRRRRETPADVEGPQVHGNTRVEVLWTAIPAVLLLGLAIYTFSRVPDVEAKPSGDEQTLAIEVTGRQFYWQYRYPNGALTFDRLVLPVDRKVTLHLSSTDVAHSWWVPEITGKRDAIPGQTNQLHFKPKETGTFRNGVCGEFCGIQHARMVFHVEVVSQEEFDAFLADEGTTDEVAVGEAEWGAACAKCHGFDGQGEIGPAIAQNPTLVDAERLRELLYEGQDQDAEGYMPPVGQGWTDGQIEALIAYIRSNERLAPPEDAGGR